MVKVRGKFVLLAYKVLEAKATYSLIQIPLRSILSRLNQKYCQIGKLVFLETKSSMSVC